MPGIVVTGPEDDGVGGKPDDEDDEDNPIFSATLDEQRRVYGQNVLPHRALKSLLALMWMALKDKVLVSVLCSLHIPFEIQWCMCIGSLVDCGSRFACFMSFQDFGTPRPAGEPPWIGSRVSLSWSLSLL